MPAVNLPASADAFIDYVKPDLNYGAQQFVADEVFYSALLKMALFRGIGDFDVSSLAAHTINSAQLERQVTVLANPGQSAILSRCTRPGSWTEGGVTWNDYDGVNPWTAGGGDFDDTGPPAAITYSEPSAVGWHAIPGMLGFVTDAIANRGNIVSVIIRLVDEDPGVNTWYSWRSKDYGSDIWRLHVNYTPAVAGRAGFTMRQRW